jgi:outer membrane protein OmpA-like peptidoglycan-associated protein
VPNAVRDRVRELSAIGGGRLAVYAVGSQARRVASYDLDLKADGDQVKDETLRAAAVDRRLALAGKEVAKASVGAAGFSLYEALRVGSDEVANTGAPVEVWLSTTVFAGSADPLSVADLAAAEPSQAVDELMNGSLKDLKLDLVDLHIVTLTPVGEEQLPLTPRSESWRNTFIVKLAERLGATVNEPLHDGSTKDAWANSSAVPPIVPLAEPHPQPPPPPPPVNSPPPSPRIDNASFKPDTATLIDPAAARITVSQIVESYRANPGRFHVKITGYCAKFGGRDGAIRTSLDRAKAVAALLQTDGVLVADLEVSGAGYDRLADSSQPPQSAAQRVVIIELIPRV